MAPGAGLEPATNRLTARSPGESSREVVAVLGNAGATGAAAAEDAVERARAVIAAIANGAVGSDLLAALADAVLDVDAVRLALEVRAGGPHALRRAIELAALVLASAAKAESGAETGRM